MAGFKKMQKKNKRFRNFFCCHCVFKTCFLLKNNVLKHTYRARVAFEWPVVALGRFDYFF